MCLCVTISLRRRETDRDNNKETVSVSLPGARPWEDTDQQPQCRSVAGYYLNGSFFFVFFFSYLLVFSCEMNNYGEALEQILNKVR